MDGRGGCCIARYANGYGAATSYDRIMLRFRPIAPKPATGTSGGGSALDNTTDVHSKSGRGRRKHAHTTNNNNNNRRCTNRKRKGSSSEESNRDAAVVTLPLLPETPDRKPVEPAACNKSPLWLNFGGLGGGGGNVKDHHHHHHFQQQQNQQAAGFVWPAATDQTVGMMPSVGSCVTVECVTDTWVDGDGLGKTDGERRINLGQDTCPGLISDGYGRVTWTNEAYRKMVGQDNVIVWLAIKEKVPPAVTVKMLTCPAFTCRVRLQQYTCAKERSSQSQTLPCDVWRMDCGGFAWRLDVKAALCLGR